MKEQDRTPRWWTIEEVAEYYGRSTRSVTEWRRKGLIPFHVLPSGRIVYDPEEIRLSMRRGGRR